MTGCVLIFRTGSIGDAVVALPALRVIARAFPDARRVLLTNRPVAATTSAMDSVIGPMDLVHETVHFDAGLASPGGAWELYRQLKPLRPHTLVWLSEGRGALRTAALRGFFRLLGVGRMIGIPERHTRDIHPPVAGAELWQSEAARLAGVVAELGTAELDDPAGWDLNFSDQERAEADAILAGWPGDERFMGFSIGGKAPVKDWGDENWRQVLGSLGADGLGLVLIGAAEEAERSDALAAAWPGLALNLCGRVGLRISALVLGRAEIYLGHDSGPMHLAAAMGTPAVAVFSGQRKPGVWFPHGPAHRPLYNRTPCFGCYLDDCTKLDKMCIKGITPAQVREAAEALLGPGSPDSEGDAAQPD